MQRTYYVPTHIKTHETDRKVEVTSKSDRERERIMLGMLRNMSDEWFVDEVSEESP